MNNLTNKEMTSPGIPRVKFKKKDHCSSQSNFYSGELPRIEKEDLKLGDKEGVKVSQLSQSENIECIIIDKKKMENIQKKDPLLSKNILKQNLKSFRNLSLGKSTDLDAQSQTTPLSSKPIFYMESYCLKMSESIILSSDTIESENDHLPSLSSDSFMKIKHLGQGKFGQVDLVVHKETGFICAMKIISKAVIKQENVEDQLIKQIKIHNSLESGNIIGFYGFFHDENSIYFLLQYATDGCLLSKFKGRSRLEEEETQNIVRGVCEGIKYIHNMEYVHRDMKPQNVVLQFGIPKICDFGWASGCDDMNLCKSYCGTPLYLSPQVIKKELYGTSVDIWSIGLITYQLLVGRVPFSIWNENDLFLVLENQIKIPEYIDRSPQCEDFIFKCLQKDNLKRMSINRIMSHAFLQSKELKSIDLDLYQEIKTILNDN